MLETEHTTRDGMRLYTGFDADHMSPENRSTAYADVREAHQSVSAWLEAAEDPNRIYNLTQERKRLAAIAWQLKHPSPRAWKY